MTARSQAIDAMKSALILLKGLGAQSPSSKLGTVGERVTQLFLVLDSMVGQLPEDLPDGVLEEVERVVDALHDVDQNWPQCGDAPANQKLDLAAARLRRIAQRLS